MLWTELFFSFFSIGKKTFAQQMLARFGFLFLIWLVGLLAHAIDGVWVSYTSNLNIYQLLFGTSFLILLGSYKVQLSINDLIPNIRPMLKLDDQQFRKLSERMERYTYSVFPCILIASGFIIFSSDVPNEIQQALTRGIELHAICMLSIAAFVYLLIGTAFWMFMSIWLIVFFVSRQPLNVKLSPKTIETFRGLSMLALWFSLGYFLAISIGIVVPLASVPATSLFEIVVSPLLLFLAVGIIGILFPFYNIHKALLKLKKQELL